MGTFLPKMRCTLSNKAIHLDDCVLNIIQLIQILIKMKIIMLGRRSLPVGIAFRSFLLIHLKYQNNSFYKFSIFIDTSWGFKFPGFHRSWVFSA